MKTNKLFNLINILIICLVIIWDSLQRTLLDGFDGRGRLLLILTAFLFLRNIFLNKRYKKALLNKKSALKFWFIWFIYVIVNTIFNYTLKTVPIDAFIAIYIFAPFVIMSTVASLPIKYLHYLLKWLGISIYSSFILYFMTSGTLGGRFVVERFDPNEFSLLILLLLVIMGISYLINKITLIQFCFLLLLPVYFTIMLGSRMGFIGVLILVLGVFLVSTKKKKIISFKRSLVILGLTILPVLYILNNTVVGERLLNTTQDNEQLTENYAEGTVLEKFGDRGLYYVLGWEAFNDAPITGIGLRNFQDNYYYTVLHSEFMVQLAELGLIGFSLYFLFNFSIFKAIKKARKWTKQSIALYNYLLIIFAVIIISSSVLFLYQSTSAAIIYGVLILLTSKQAILKLN